VQQAIGTNMQRLERLYVPQKSKKTEYLEGAPAEIARKLVDKFRNEIRVL
jgi:electron transfer flavoprotein beta subunit